jgi:hypothetical protein
VKPCNSVHLGGTGLLVPPAEQQAIAFLPSVRNLVSLLFAECQGLSCCQGQWGVLGLHALWGGNPPGALK